MSYDRNTEPADPALTVGERIKFYRRRRGMTREILGGLVGKTARWVKAVESGQIQQPKLPMLVRLADALKVRDLAQLTGGVSMPITMFQGPGHPALPAVRDAINAVAVPSGEPSPLAHLGARVEAAWRVRHAAPDHRTVLGGLLPPLIADAKHAARAYEGEDRRRALALLAGVYNLAQFYLAYQPAAELLWRVAERSLMAAEESGDPMAIGGAVWLLAQAHRDSGDFEAAETVNRQTLDTLSPRMADAEDPGLRAMWGALLFEVAYTAARAGEAGKAWHWWDRADRVARGLPESHYDAMTSFSRAVMGPHAVTVAVELRQGRESVRQAKRTAGVALPSHPRRGRHLIEVARAWQIGGDAPAALAALKGAYVAAPETIRYNGYARRMIYEQVEGPAALRRDARDLADKVGLLL